MTIKVHVVERRLSDTLEVFIINHADDGKRVLHTDGDMSVWEVLPPSGELVDERFLKPTTVLPWDTGRALLEALVRHYQGAEDTRQLRKDYEAERRRVDEQGKVIADIARTLASGRAGAAPLNF